MPPLPMCNKWSKNLTQFKDCQYCSCYNYASHIDRKPYLAASLAKSSRRIMETNHVSTYI